ncbi:MAG: helix-turn-helix domain-containing protein [Lachnospiraceae bacterium]|nr:helix-turn-helix domain-containing protein [Lachnospiraceae bacterium]
MNFSENLICLRKQKGMSQEQLGEKVGVTRQTVSKWELGDTTPDMDKLIMLSELFGMSMDELVGKSATSNEEGSLCMMRVRNHYEYKSKKCIGGIPLIHINIGTGLQKARGIIAIGNLAQGLVSIGIIAMGAVSVGALSLGLISFGAFCLGLLLAAGGIAVGGMAFGGIAAGILAAGGLAIGIYSLGGLAIGGRIAMGGFAKGTVAIGDKSIGDIVFDINKAGQEEAIREAIISKYPKISEFILKLFTSAQ